MSEALRIVLATSNQGKLREISALLQPYSVDVVAQDDMGVEGPEETGLTYVENALLKARHAARSTGLGAIADDSGISVDALMGGPGIYSARYDGPEATYESNCVKLLAALDGVAKDERGAQFICSMVFLRHADDPCPVISEGVWAGEIAIEPQGEGGFGYDPVFIPSGLTKSAAELDPAEKNRQSHRGAALGGLLSGLKSCGIIS